MKVGCDVDDVSCSHKVCGDKYVHDDYFEDGCIWRVTHEGASLVPRSSKHRNWTYTNAMPKGWTVTVADGTKGMTRGL